MSEWVFRPVFLFLVGTGGGGSRGECVEVEVVELVTCLADGVWMFFLSYDGKRDEGKWCSLIVW